MNEAVCMRLVTHLLRDILPSPYKFELDAHPAMDITVFHQKDNRRLLVGLLNLQEQRPTIPIGATVRVQLPSGAKARRVLLLPGQKEIPYQKIGPYLQFQVAPFKIECMMAVDYL
jgi:hypothetical protein